jgi:hypothetical protein
MTFSMKNYDKQIGLNLEKTQYYDSNIFFAENEKAAKRRISELAKIEKFYRNKKVRLSEFQVPHIMGWKTYRVVRK